MVKNKIMIGCFIIASITIIGCGGGGGSSSSTDSSSEPSITEVKTTNDNGVAVDMPKLAGSTTPLTTLSSK